MEIAAHTHTYTSNANEHMNKRVECMKGNSCHIPIALLAKQAAAPNSLYVCVRVRLSVLACVPHLWPPTITYLLFKHSERVECIMHVRRRATRAPSARHSSHENSRVAIALGVRASVCFVRACVSALVRRAAHPPMGAWMCVCVFANAHAP